MKEHKKLTNEVGAPVADNENAITAGPRGPVVMQDVWLMEKMAHFNREVIPEVEKTKAATDRYHELSQQIREIEKRIAEITELKKHIINYSKTKATCVAYRKSWYSLEFYDKNMHDILLHLAAKKAFDSITEDRIPSLKDLQVEFNANFSTKKPCLKNIHYKKCNEKNFKY